MRDEIQVHRDFRVQYVGVRNGTVFRLLSETGDATYVIFIVARLEVQSIATEAIAYF